jgi:hypothetical protein
MCNHKPFYRISLPLKNDEIDNYNFVYDEGFCSERNDLVDYFGMLAKQMNDINEYVELCPQNKSSFSLRIYQLYVSVCTEIENNFRGIFNANAYSKSVKELSMHDYYKLNKTLKLSEYIVKLKKTSETFQPFSDWSCLSYKPLLWYVQYNAVKHNRLENYPNANVGNLLNAMSALFILLFAQFSLGAYNGLQYWTGKSSPYDNGFDFNDLPFKITQYPEFSENDKYDFDWNTLKLTDDRFSKFRIG